MKAGTAVVVGAVVLAGAGLAFILWRKQTQPAPPTPALAPAAQQAPPAVTVAEVGSGAAQYSGPSPEARAQAEAFAATLQAGGPARTMGGVTASRTAAGAVRINAISLPFFRKK